MNRAPISRIYRIVMMVALLAALLGVLTGSGRAAAAPGPCLACGPLFTVTPEQTVLATQGGETVKFAIKLHNRSFLDRVVYLNAGGSTQWPISLSSSSVLLPEGGDALVFLSVTVPSTLTDPPAQGDTQDHIVFKASDKWDTIYTDLYVVIAVNQ